MGAVLGFPRDLLVGLQVGDELRGGRHPVSTEMATILLDSCPALRRLNLKDVDVVGDWSAIWQRMDSHSLEALEVNERY